MCFRVFAELAEINFKVGVPALRTAAAEGVFVLAVDAVEVKPFDPRWVALLVAMWMTGVTFTVLAMHAMEPKRW